MRSLESLFPRETPASMERMKTWPLEVRALIALLAKPRLGENRRKQPRHPLRLEMVLQFNDDDDDGGDGGGGGLGVSTTTNATIYTRDTSGTILGFLTYTPPRAGQRAVLKFDDASGVTRRMPCRVVRCRQVRDGWFEGTLDMAPSTEDGASAPGLWRKLRGLVGAR